MHRAPVPSRGAKQITTQEKQQMLFGIGVALVAVVLVVVVLVREAPYLV